MKKENDLSEKEWKAIGNRIKMRRKSCGLKQSELAESIDISTTHMSSIENGKQHPSVYVLIRLSEQLRTTPDFFLLGSMRPNNISLNIIDSLKLCDESHLLLIESLISAVIDFSDAKKIDKK